MDKHTYTRASTVNEEGDQRLQMKEALLLSLSFSLLWEKKMDFNNEKGNSYG